MIKVFKKFPPDILIMIGTLLATQTYFYYAGKGLFEKFAYDTSLAGMIIIPITIYFILINLIIPITNNHTNIFSKKKLNELVKSLTSSIYLCCYTIINIYASINCTLIAYTISNRSPDIIQKNSLFLTNLEISYINNLAGIKLAEFITSTIIEEIIIWTYINITSIMIITLISVLFFRPVLFRKLLMSIFLGCAIYSIGWTLYPAIAPNEVVILNSFSQSFDEQIINIIKNFNPSPYLEKNIQFLTTIWAPPNQEYFSISTIPSYHAYVAIALTSIAFSIHRYLGYAYIVMTIINFIGTFYTLQHYLIDPILGTLIAFPVIKLNNIIFRIEENNYQDPYFLHSMQKQIENTNQQILSYVTKRLTRFKSI